MGGLAKILSFVRTTRNGAPVSDVKTDPGGGANVTAEHFGPAGDDSSPLPGDFVYLGGVPRTGGRAALGYLDPGNTPQAGAGEKRIYARDPNTGAVAVELWLKNDGSAVLTNAAGSLTLDAAGNVACSGSLTAAGVTDSTQNVTLGTHTHSGGVVPAPDPGS